MQDQELLKPHYIRADQSMRWVLIGLLVVSGIIAVVYQSWIAFLFVGIPTATVPIMLSISRPGELVTRLSFAFGFMLMSALHIHQAMGLIEMHFSIFVLLGFLLFYKDPLPILAAAGLIALHHLSFNYLQASGVGVYVFESKMGLDIVMLHAVFVVAEAAVLIWMAMAQREEAKQALLLAKAMHHVAEVEGQLDLTQRIGVERMPATKAFDQMLEDLSKVLAVVLQSGSAMTQSAVVVEGQAKNCAKLSSDQQMQTGIVATSVYQIAQSSQEVAGSAQMANDHAERALAQAKSTVQTVNNAHQSNQRLIEQLERSIQQVNELASEVQSIGGVMEMITEIAEQTDLLALNATIEAARAGEFGRGFAVVADEVRTLSRRASSAVHDIYGSIGQVQAKAKQVASDISGTNVDIQGTLDTSAQAVKALESVLDSIQGVQDTNQQIAVATEEQSTAIREISDSIFQVESLAREILEAMENTVKEVGGVKTQVDTVGREINRFRLSAN
ncbi:MAG: hypothetical protein HWE20_07950 [Gammaproteobacteria bacterium]|nr:hypothetical protein [Gammaproteobacteria bacterium]